MTCSHLLCDCIWPRPPAQKAVPDQGFQESWCTISKQDANPQQICEGRVGPRLDSLFEQSRLLSKLKHTSKPALESSPSSRLNHPMLKFSDLSAQRHQLPQGETEVHNRAQTLEDSPFSGPAGMMTPIALHSSPFAWGLDPSWWGQGIPLHAT